MFVSLADVCSCVMHSFISAQCVALLMEYNLTDPLFLMYRDGNFIILPRLTSYKFRIKQRRNNNNILIADFWSQFHWFQLKINWIETNVCDLIGPKQNINDKSIIAADCLTQITPQQPIWSNLKMRIIDYLIEWRETEILKISYMFCNHRVAQIALLCRFCATQS